MPLNNIYRAEMKRRLAITVCLQRIDKIDDEVERNFSEYVENVLDDFLGFDDIFDNHDNRALYIWGSYKYGRKLGNLLMKYCKLDFGGYIDSYINSGETDVISGSKIIRDDMYIIIPLMIHKDIIDTLLSKGFKEKVDFFYPRWEIARPYEGKRLQDTAI